VSVNGQGLLAFSVDA